MEVVYFIKGDDDSTVIQSVDKSLLFAMRTFTVATAYCKVTMITSTHILTLSSLRWKGLHYLLSRINKFNRDFFHWQCFSLVCPLKTTWNRFYPISPQTRAKMAGIVNKVYLAEWKAVIHFIGTKNNDFQKMNCCSWFMRPFVAGGGVLPRMAYMGRLPKKGLPFSGFRYVKGREIYHLGL